MKKKPLQHVAIYISIYSENVNIFIEIIEKKKKIYL